MQTDYNHFLCNLISHLPYHNKIQKFVHDLHERIGRIVASALECLSSSFCSSQQEPMPSPILKRKDKNSVKPHKEIDLLFPQAEEIPVKLDRSENISGGSLVQPIHSDDLSHALSPYPPIFTQNSNRKEFFILDYEVSSEIGEMVFSYLTFSERG